MLRIAICDAHTEYRKATADIWSRALFDVEEVRFKLYANGGDLIEDIRRGSFRQDILILDLLLPDVSGLKLLEYVRKHDDKLTIIIQTEAEELAAVGYRYRVFDFIVKHRSLKDVSRVINRCQAEIMSDDDGILTISVQGSPQRLRLDQITFFESDARRIRAFGPGEDVTFYMKMDELEEQLCGRGFLRCHQSYLVNVSQIRGFVSGVIVLTNKNEVPVSRRYAKAVRAYLAQTGEADQV